MKVKELIECLKRFDPELMVVYSVDEEGNDFLPVLFQPIKGKINESLDEFISIDSIKQAKKELEEMKKQKLTDEMQKLQYKIVYDMATFKGKDAVCIN